MPVLIVTSSKGCLYEDMSLQMDTMFHNNKEVGDWVGGKGPLDWFTYASCVLYIFYNYIEETH
jgi:hypothetical protein